MLGFLAFNDSPEGGLAQIAALFSNTSTEPAVKITAGPFKTIGSNTTRIVAELATNKEAPRPARLIMDKKWNIAYSPDSNKLGVKYGAANENLIEFSANNKVNLAVEKNTTAGQRNYRAIGGYQFTSAVSPLGFNKFCQKISDLANTDKVDIANDCTLLESGFKKSGAKEVTVTFKTVGDNTGQSNNELLISFPPFVPLPSGAQLWNSEKLLPIKSAGEKTDWLGWSW